MALSDALALMWLSKARLRKIQSSSKRRMRTDSTRQPQVLHSTGSGWPLPLVVVQRFKLNFSGRWRLIFVRSSDETTVDTSSAVERFQGGAR
eukprot:SAG11_NODE_7194_length_1180_cov_1.260870_1_plen_92_part_00